VAERAAAGDVCFVAVSTPNRDDFFQSVRGLTLALATIALLAFIFPSAVAARLQRARVSRAEAQVQAVADRLHAAGLEAMAATLKAQGIAVLTGPGDPIVEATDRAWITSRQAPLQSYLALPVDAVTPDPWLRALQIDVGAREHGGRVWVLSAGPNGIIETPFDVAASNGPSGDDVAAIVP
jgi:type II secretory pathway pseudopilin PulG